MPRTFLRRSKRNPDYWEVVYGTTVKGSHLSKTEAKRQAEAIRNRNANRAKRIKYAKG